MSRGWSEKMHEAIATAIADHADSDQSGEVLTAWVLVCETRDSEGSASIGYYRGPETAASWLHRGMLSDASRFIATERDREDDE